MEIRADTLELDAGRITLHCLKEGKLAAAHLIRFICLSPLAIGCKIACLLSPLLRYAERLEGEAGGFIPHETEKQIQTHEKLVIPSSILYESYRILINHGRKFREWIVALGWQEVNGIKVVTHVCDLRCSMSHSTGAEPDYSSLADVLKFYETCGCQIAGLVHIHPWDSRTVSPSSIDIDTHRRWEELYDGRFIGIVFSNSGVFRIFHGGKSVFKPVVVGKDVKKIGRDLYELERKNIL